MDFQPPELRENNMLLSHSNYFYLATLATNTENVLVFRIDEILYHSDWAALGYRRLVIMRRNWFASLSISLAMIKKCSLKTIFGGPESK